MKILLVDDDRELLDVTAYALRREGFNVVTATDGTQALKRWRQDRPELVVMDVGLPGVSGLDVCHRIRASGQTPVILLTGLTSDENVVQGFRVGADDYVTKPFSPRQLAVRIRAVHRRAVQAGAPEPKRELQVGTLLLDGDGHEVTEGDRTVRLTRTEFRLLYVLAVNAGRVVAGARLVEYVWGYDGSSVSLLKTHISHLRGKLGLGVSGEGSIACVPGVGYRLSPREVASPPGDASRQSAPAAPAATAARGGTTSQPVAV
jgi:DNA-binding response OmpR family regulator